MSYGEDVFPQTGAASEWNFMVGCATETASIGRHGHGGGHRHGGGGHGHRGPGHRHHHGGHGWSGGPGYWLGPAIVPVAELYTFEDFVASVEDEAMRRLLASIPAAERSALVVNLNAIRQSELAGRLPQGTLARTINDLASRVAASVSGLSERMGPWTDLRDHQFHVGALPVDTFPPEKRPYQLKNHAHVVGTIKSAPLDLAARATAVDEALKAAGWNTYRVSIGTDFEGPMPWLGPLNLPVPKDQPIEYLLHRTDRAYTPADAQSALATALRAVNTNYSPIAAWAGEVSTHVVQPTVADTAAAVKQTASTATAATQEFGKLVPWIAAGTLGLAAIYALATLKPFIPSR